MNILFLYVKYASFQTKINQCECVFERDAVDFANCRVAIPEIVARNLLAVIAGSLLFNASFIALALRCVVVAVVIGTLGGVGEIPFRASRVSKVSLEVIECYQGDLFYQLMPA